MSQMNREILACMSGLTVSGENGLCAHFIFPEEFVGFQGHFENHPILPGICKILAVVAMCSKHYDKVFRLKNVVSAKYVAPVTYAQRITVDCDLMPRENGAINVHAVIKKEEKKVAMLKLALEVERI